LDPDGNHIALGGDLDGCDELPAGFEGVQSYPALAQRLLHRGVDEQILRKIFWENALGVMDKCCI
jgi:membrane dipeptidase